MQLDIDPENPHHRAINWEDYSVIGTNPSIEVVISGVSPKHGWLISGN